MMGTFNHEKLEVYQIDMKGKRGWYFSVKVTKSLIFYFTNDFILFYEGWVKLKSTVSLTW